MKKWINSNKRKNSRKVLEKTKLNQEKFENSRIFSNFSNFSRIFLDFFSIFLIFLVFFLYFLDFSCIFWIFLVFFLYFSTTVSRNFSAIPGLTLFFTILDAFLEFTGLEENFGLRSQRIATNYSKNQTVQTGDFLPK